MNAITKLELAAVAPRAFPAVVSAHDLHRHEVLDIVMNRRFGAEYQPIVDTVSGETLGFEALARFFRPGGGTVAPDSVFELLHDDTLLLFHTELEMKTLQIVAAPPTELLFLNLDPDSFAAAETPDFNVFTELFRRHQRPGRDILIEVIENLHIQDVVLSRRMIEALTQANIRIAMDDLGVSNGLVSFDAFVDSSYVKFDRSWVRNRETRGRTAVMEWFLNMARSLSVKTVLEGIETEQDLAFARELGFDCVQGFLYRERFILERP